MKSSSPCRIKRLKGHTSYVNSVHPARRGEPMIVSGSDDCMIKVWDQRKRNAVQSLNNMYQVTAVTFNDTTDQASHCKLQHYFGRRRKSVIELVNALGSLTFSRHYRSSAGASTTR